MKVTLLANTPEPEKIIACAAKLCYSNSEIENLMNDLTEEKIDRFIKMLTSLGHLSPVEHCSFTFGIEGMSRVCANQLVRHRIASYSQVSQRYVEIDNFEYVTPCAIAEVDNARVMFNEIMDKTSLVYGEITEVLTTNYINQGMDKLSAIKKAIEDARYVLPNACTTKLIVTMNIRSLLNFFKLRCCNRAQWEIREIANEMLKICKDVAPLLFAKAGASCINGKCSEGKMSCGKIQL